MNDNIRRFTEETVPDEDSTITDANQQVHVVDTTFPPVIYATDNPLYYAKYCIDFQPTSVPTIASFETAQEAHAYIKELFPQHYATWFPLVAGHEQDYVTCLGCRGYVLRQEVHAKYCKACRKLLKQFAS